MNDIKQLCENILCAKNELINQRRQLNKAESNLSLRYKILEDYLNNESKNNIRLFNKIEPCNVNCGQLVFGFDGYEWYCHMIEEVYNIYDDWKAYCADDGCRYGLRNHYILNEECK